MPDGDLKLENKRLSVELCQLKEKTEEEITKLQQQMKDDERKATLKAVECKEAVAECERLEEELAKEKTEVNVGTRLSLPLSNPTFVSNLFQFLWVDSL